MTTDAKKTISYMKEKKTVSAEIKENVKEFARIRKAILKALEAGPNSIPGIADITGLPLPVVTYNLMSCRKYGLIEETNEITDDDYYLYELKKKD